jgi:hypothetical protein
MIKLKTFRLYLLAFLVLGAIVGVVYGIKAVSPQLSNEDFSSIGFFVFLGFMASLNWFDYGIDWNTYKFKNKSKDKRK